MKKFYYTLLIMLASISLCFPTTSVEQLIPADNKLPIMTDAVKYSGAIELLTKINQDDFNNGILDKIKEKYVYFANEEEGVTVDMLSKEEIDATKELLNKVYNRVGATYTLKDNYDKKDAYNLNRLFIDYSFTPEYAKIYSLEKMFTTYIQSALSMTNKFDIINTDISKEIIEEKVKSLTGMTNKSEKFESDFSRYVLTATYTPLNVSGNNFLTIKVIDAVTGEIIYLSFTEVNEANVRQNIFRELFTMAGLDFKSADESVNKRDKSKYVDGFTINILPNKGAVTAVLYALDTQYKFFTHNIKVPPLPAGDYIISVEKAGYITEQNVILIFDSDKKNIDIRMRKQYGSLVINTAEDSTNISIDKNPPYLSTNTFYIPRQDIGTHRIKAYKNKYYTQYKTIEIEDGGQTEVDIDLRVKPVKTLFTSNIKGTSVYIDNVFYGITPLIATIVEGEHTVEFKRKYYKPQTKSIIVDTPEIRIVEANLTVDNEQYKLKREFYPHFFMELSAYWGVYSYHFLKNSTLYKGEQDNAAMAGNMMFMGGFGYSMGLDIEYLFFGVRALFSLYNNDPQWEKSTRPLAVNIDIIPYLGFKVYPGLYTSFDFGIGYDLAVLKSEPALNIAECPMTKYSAKSLGLFQNYILMFDITFYNKYKRAAFGFEFMYRLDGFDSFIPSNHACGYLNPGMLYFGIKFPFCYTSSKKRQQTKDYSILQNRERQNNDIPKLLKKINSQDGAKTRNE